jgi:nucleotide-binding universal stress UspA family protein
MIKSILVPIDGSDHAFKALDLASDIAVAHDARVLLLHAVADRVPTMEEKEFAKVEHIEGPLDQMPYTIVEGQLMTAARSRAHANGLKDIETAIEPGDPAQVIIERAKDFDMIVMGCRGLGPLGGLLQGSVSQKVIQLTDAACVTVK